MGSKRKLVMGSDHDDDSDNSRVEETQLDLERSIKELYRNEEDANTDDPRQGDPPMSEVRKQELISKLGEARQKEADLERMARRIVWRREVQRTIAGNAEFKEIMEEVPLEEVEVEEKPRMSRMSMEWRDAFKKERTSFLFPQVLSTLLKLKVTSGPMPKILAYRHVCKASKESVDDLFSSGHFIPQMWSGCLYHVFDLPASQFKTMRISKFDNLEKAMAFTRGFNHARNPFFTRNIEISLWSPPPKFCQAIHEILRRWGKELRSAKLDLRFFENDSAESRCKSYNQLVTWLKLMPNLRVLGIEFKDIGTVNYVKLTKHIAKNPLPAMPHLTRIAMVESSNPSLISHSIFSKFKPALERVGSPDLQELHLCYKYIDSEADVRNIIKNLSNWRLPVKRLGLELNNELKSHNRECSRILLLDNEALTCKGVFLEMPQLEELLLVCFYRINLGTLDFLLPCKSLKVLRLHTMRVTNWKPSPNHPPPEDNDNGIFKITDPADRDRLYRSPIWKLLPELTLIVYKIVPIRMTGKFANGMQPIAFGERVTYQYT